MKKQRTPESGGISKLNLEQSFSYIKLFIVPMFLDQKMRNRDLACHQKDKKAYPPTCIHTYVLVKLYLYCYLYTVPYQPSSTYLPTYSTLQGQEKSRINVLYIFLVRHASFINFLFPFRLLLQGEFKNYLQYLPYLAFFHGCLLLFLY